MATTYYYRVKTSWDASSQLGAFTVLDNAKKCADAHPGYFVFGEDGIAVYPLPYMIQAKVSLAIFSSSTSNAKTGSTGVGTFTITQVKNRRGKLLSGDGWVALADIPLVMIHDYTVTYAKNSDTLMPYTITQDRVSTPLWNQHKWTGDYKKYIQANGCGHCCAAMAARLHGVEDITPATEYAKCVKLFGQPKSGQGHYISCKGIMAVLKAYGVSAGYLQVTTPTLSSVKKKITTALKAGKQAILWCHKYSGVDNPFTSSDHYVMAVGYDKKGNIVIANSSGKIQLTDIDTIGKSIHHGCTGKATGWGAGIAASAGAVIVG